MLFQTANTIFEKEKKRTLGFGWSITVKILFCVRVLFVWIVNDPNISRPLVQNLEIILSNQHVESGWAEGLGDVFSQWVIFVNLLFSPNLLFYAPICFRVFYYLHRKVGINNWRSGMLTQILEKHYDCLLSTVDTVNLESMKTLTVHLKFVALNFCQRYKIWEKNKISWVVMTEFHS